MTIQSESPQINAQSPLRGFDFTRDWLAGKAFPRQFLAPSDELLRLRLEALSSGAWQPWNSDEISETRSFNQSFGNDAGAALTETLGRENALCVVTGQQPDFLASPLYVLHKALSACTWAKKLSDDLVRPVIPIFWVASDDDDFAELKQAWMVSFTGELIDAGARLSRGRGVNSGSPAYLWDLAEGAPRAEQDIARSLAGWPGGNATADWLKQAIKDHPNFESLFCYLLTKIIGPDFPMLFVAPRLKVFRKRQTAVLSADVRVHDQLNTGISKAAKDFQSAGYPVTLKREPKALNFFRLQNGRRHRLLQTDGVIVAIDPHTHKESARFTESELLRELESRPEDFAPNVVTRPVIQDVVLPTAAYIAGPGELAYLAVLGEAYLRFDCARSAVIPRTLVTMDPRGIRGDWSGAKPPEELSDTVLSRGGGTGEILLAHLNDLMTDTNRNIERMRAGADGQRPEIQLAFDKTQRHFMYGVEQLKRRLARQVSPDQWNEAARLAAIMSPAGGPQERMLAPWNFTKVDDWDALARHLATLVDYTATSPQTAPIPAWLEDIL